MKLLHGGELAGYIKERQAKQVRALRQADRVLPTLAIVQTIDDPVIDTYVALKQTYGTDILVEVEVHKVGQSEVRALIERLNDDARVQGIILQLPLADKNQTDELINFVSPSKDVDGLGKGAHFDPATPMAINWLLAGYNITLDNMKIVIIGNGRLVGAPLARMWQNSGYNVTVLHDSLEGKEQTVLEADIVVTAVGSPGLVTSEMLAPGAIVIDAATSAEHGKIVGDVASDVRERHDLTITPEKGGVGPLTVCALFDNVIRASRETIT